MVIFFLTLRLSVRYASIGVHEDHEGNVVASPARSPPHEAENTTMRVNDILSSSISPPEAPELESPFFITKVQEEYLKEQLKELPDKVVKWMINRENGEMLLIMLTTKKINKNTMPD